MFFKRADALGTGHHFFPVRHREFLYVRALGFLAHGVVVPTQKFASHDGVVGFFAVIEFALTRHTES